MQKLHEFAKSLSATMGKKISVNMRDVVKLPKDADVNEYVIFECVTIMCVYHPITSTLIITPVPDTNFAGGLQRTWWSSTMSFVYFLAPSMLVSLHLYQPSLFCMVHVRIAVTSPSLVATKLTN